MASDKNRTSQTIKRVSGRGSWRVFVWISAALSLAADANAVFALLFGGIKMSYVVLPLVLMILSACLIVVLAFSNFRFRRTLIAPIAYAVLTVAGMAVLVSLASTADYTVFTTVSLVAWAVFQCLSAAAVVVSAVNASGRGIAYNVVTWILTIVFAVCGVGYFTLVTVNGFFGQNPGNPYNYELRTLTYEYNDEGYYEVSGVMDGRGNTVLVPETFNGKRVGAVSCDIFADESVSAVVLRCGGDTVFTDTEVLTESRVGEGTDVYAAKSSVDGLRSYFYGEAAGAGNGNGVYAAACLNLANSIMPETEGDEVYITFSYTETALAAVGGNVLPVWVGSAGDTFSVLAYADVCEYVAYTDMSDEGVLRWAYDNLGGYIFTGITYRNGTSPDGTKITSSATADVNFERVYAVTVGEDNDGLYEDEDFRSFTDGTVSTGYRYVTAETCAYLTDGITPRDGFTVSWEYSADGGENRNGLTSLSSVIGDGITIYPVWTLDNPVISAITAVSDTQSVSFQVTYGDNIHLDAEALSPAENISLKYEWSFGDTATGTDDKNLYLRNITPMQGGTYSVTVTAYSDTYTTLTSSVTKDIYVGVEKKTLSFVWTLPSLTYSGTYKDIGCEYSEDDVINGDAISFSVLGGADSVMDAASYRLYVSLTGTCADLYKTDDTYEISFAVTAYTLTVDWLEDELIYNGAFQYPSYAYSVSSLGRDTVDDSLLGTYVTGSIKDVGTGTCRLTVTNTNYILDDTGHNFSVTPKEVALVWDTEALIYNGTEQHAVAEISGLVEGESEKLIYSAGGINAGTYHVTASLSEGSNYVLSADETGTDYEIVAKTISLSWSEKDETDNDGERVTLVYDGTERYITATPSGVTEGDLQEFTAALSYTGSAKDVGTYTMYVSFTDTNYILEDGSRFASVTYIITPYELTVTWVTSLTYNGNGQLPPHSYSVSVLGGDTVDDSLLGASVTGAVKDVGEGYAYITITNGNYGIANPSTLFTVAQKEVTLVWTSETFVYDGTEKEIHAEISGLIEGESEELIYSGGGVNAGTYTMTASLPDGSNYVLSTSEKGCVFTINPKEIYFVWSPTDGDAEYNMDGIATYIYSSYERSMTAAPQGVIDGDTGTFTQGMSYEGASASAGTHTMYVSFSDTNYILSDGTRRDSCEYAVNPKEIQVVWTGETVFVYSGVELFPEHMFDISTWGQDTLTDDFLGVTVNGKIKNVGESTAYITITNANYTVSDAGQSFSVTPKEVALVWDTSPLEYNGTEQHAVAEISGLVEGESEELIYSEGGINAGTYHVTASLSEGSNYVLSADETGTDYEIVAKTISLSWSEKDETGNDGETVTLVYDGTERYITATPSGVTEGDLQAFTAALSYTGSAKDVGTYTMYVSFTDTNYILEDGSRSASVAYIITPYELTVTWVTSLTYNGNAQLPTYSYSVSVLGGDTVDDSLLGTVLYGDPVKDVGEGYAYITITNGNYEIANPSALFTVAQKEVTLVWTSETFVYDGTEKGIQAEISGLIEGDSEELIYSGGGVNAGTYTMTASLPEGSNYVLSPSEKGCIFTIEKAKISVSWQSDGMDEDGTYGYLYDGQGHAPALSEGEEYVDYIYYDSDGNRLLSAPSDVGDYCVVITVKDEYENNYEFEAGAVTRADFTITAPPEEEEEQDDGVEDGIS